VVRDQRHWSGSPDAAIVTAGRAQAAGTFLAAWRRLRGLRDPECFDACLKQILINSCRAIGRRRRRVSIREINMDELDAVDEPADDRVWQRERPGPSLDDIERAFGRLSVDER
jgi:DNA-directed RNA polymerase specialized sigma24 family protein